MLRNIALLPDGDFETLEMMITAQPMEITEFSSDGMRVRYARQRANQNHTYLTRCKLDLRCVTCYNCNLVRQAWTSPDAKRTSKYDTPYAKKQRTE